LADLLRLAAPSLPLVRTLMLRHILSVAARFKLNNYERARVL
jgi:hypothetical protein